MGADFSPEQKRWLEGFASGSAAMRALGGGMAAAAAPPAPAEPIGPDAAQMKAQDRALASGGKLSDPEKWKRNEHPFDAYGRLLAAANEGSYPNPEDDFRWRYHGLFYAAPTQDAFMCRVRLPNGILNHWQFAGLADLADAYAGGYSHVTTRAGLQLREIAADNAQPLLESLQLLGLCAKGSGADNVRNVAGSPIAGIDPHELIDTRPLARAWHFHILNDRSLYGLPRKFNVAFDGGGVIPVLEETNDIGFQAVAARAAGASEPEIWMKVLVGGISGHRQLAIDAGLLCRPKECTRVADAIVRVFIEHGDRCDRNKARLKYLIDRWGVERFIAAVEERLGRPLARANAHAMEPRHPGQRLAHLGAHAQKQDGLKWIGVATPVGRLTADEMRGLAGIARNCGDGDVRLTIWQNVIISGVPDEQIATAQAGLSALGLSSEPSSLRAGLVACTGNAGCKFAACDTKAHALMIADHVEARLALDAPVNVHVTGCRHSCAQHFIGDIGLLGAKVSVNDDGDTVEGYDIVIGGGFASNAKIGRELWKGIKADDCAVRIEGLLRTYMMGRRDGESFHEFANRHTAEELRGLLEQPTPLEAVA